MNIQLIIKKNIHKSAIKILYFNKFRHPYCTLKILIIHVLLNDIDKI